MSDLGYIVPSVGLFLGLVFSVCGFGCFYAGASAIAKDRRVIGPVLILSGGLLFVTGAIETAKWIL